MLLCRISDCDENRSRLQSRVSCEIEKRNSDRMFPAVKGGARWQCSSLNVRYQVSHPYRTTGKIIALHSLIFAFFDSRRQDRRFWTGWYQALPEFSLLFNFLLNQILTRYCRSQKWYANNHWLVFQCVLRQALNLIWTELYSISSLCCVVWGPQRDYVSIYIPLSALNEHHNQWIMQYDKGRILQTWARH
jgi:hypothetical protein